MRPPRTTLRWFPFLIAALLFASPVAAVVSTAVTTSDATFVSFDGATLNGVLTAMGTTAVAPTVLGLAGAAAYVNNEASFLINVPTGTEFLIYQTGRTVGTGGCGVLVSIELNGNAGTKLAGSFKVDGQGESAVELWYEDTPSVGTNRVLWGNWTGTCGASYRHVIAAIALSGVNEASPFSDINLQNDATVPPTGDTSLSVQLGASPSAGQIRSVIVSDVSTTSGSARMADPTGLDIQKWGWMVSGSGTTYCSTGNVGCVEGGFSSGNALTADTDQPGDTFWWAYSGVLVNGEETPVSSVQVGFEWGDTASLGNVTSTQTKTSTGAFSLILTGLDGGTLYYFRARAVGTGTVTGSTLTFTTIIGPMDFFLLAAFVVFLVGGASILAAWAMGRKRGGGV